MKKTHFKIHIFIIAILLIIFFTLIILSTSDKNIKTNYEFEKEVNITSQNMFDIRIGTLSVNNSGFLGSRIVLKNLVGCTFAQGQQISSYEIIYGGSKYSRNFGFNGRSQMFIEIESKKTSSYPIFIRSSYVAPLKSTLNKTTGFNVIKENLYIFDMNSDNYYYDYCMNADKNNAISMIRLNINVAKNE